MNLPKLLESGKWQYDNKEFDTREEAIEYWNIQMQVQLEEQRKTFEQVKQQFLIEAEKYAKIKATK